MTSNTIQKLKQQHLQFQEKLTQRFNTSTSIQAWVAEQTDHIDAMLILLWAEAGLDKVSHLSLAAVGGYGRSEMFPYSDVDVLILLGRKIDQAQEDMLASFVSSLWDTGLEVGHSVRSLDQCVEEANNDLSIITNMLEGRFLVGDDILFQQLQLAIGPQNCWPVVKFFDAKIAERNTRLEKFESTTYSVEPNLKESSGGLRDLQMVSWVSQRLYLDISIEKLLNIGLINSEEYQQIIQHRDFLWQVRFALHLLAGRKEDRLLFDHQRNLAHKLGFEASEEGNNDDIEAFMQRYYQAITELRRYHKLLLGLLRKIIYPYDERKLKPINQLYYSYEGYLALADDESFAEHPHALLEIFHIMQLCDECRGLTPHTIRSLRRHLDLIDDEYRENTHHKQIFINILSEPQGVTAALRLMNQHGVLAAYLPKFASIVGRMQYDLFHAYTVDEHTLRVLDNSRSFSISDLNQDMPETHEVFKTLKNPMLLHLSAIFHDIAKGRGGSHAELGADDALVFCLDHGLSEYEADAVSWLVRQHLLMTRTTQRCDISDPDEIAKVVADVPSVDHWRMLFLLTVADVKGTHPELMNHWKYSMLKQLFVNVEHQLLSHSVEPQMPMSEAEDHEQAFWQGFNVQHVDATEEAIYHWQYQQVMAHSKQHSNAGEAHPPLAQFYPQGHRGSSVVMVYSVMRPALFLRIVTALERQSLNIVSASITSSEGSKAEGQTQTYDYALDNLYVMDSQQQQITDLRLQDRICEAIIASIESEAIDPPSEQVRMPRQLKYFHVDTHVEMGLDPSNSYNTLFIQTGDRPGLLSDIARILHQIDIHIYDAKINTLGEKAEDMFFVASKDRSIISEREYAWYCQNISEYLDMRQAVLS